MKTNASPDPVILAAQLMAMEMISELLSSTGPGELGQILTEQLRELTGARTVLLVVHPDRPGPHKALNASPSRRASLFSTGELAHFCPKCSPEELASLPVELPSGHPLRATLLRAGIESLLRFPLNAAGELVGSLLLLDLPESERIDEVATTITPLLPVIAMALKNSLAHQRIEEQAQALALQARDLERRIVERTADLEASNRALAASRHAALNMMENAVAAQKRAEATAAALEFEIIERRRAEEALRASEERHRTLLQTAMDGFWMVDMQGRLLEVNETYCRMSGYSAQELLSMRVSDLEAGETADDTTAQPRKFMVKGEDRFESRHRRKDGSIFAVEVSVQFRPTGGGRLVAFLRDITERKQTEARLQQAQKLESIGTLAGGIAHDFNNILYPLLGFTELLKEDIPADSPLQEYIDQILRATLRSKDLVKQILAFSRKGDQSAKPVQLYPIITEALKLLRSSIPTTIDIRQDIESDCVVVADPTQIHQIIMNLATNAYHAMEEAGGKLHVSLKPVEVTSESDSSAVHTLTPGKYALLTVSDTGTGIHKDILDKIFDPYFTTKGVGKGTGLGLSVVHGIVKTHKGDIRISSNPGKGTEVYVYLLIMERTVSEKKSEQSDPLPGGTEKILLVEDEEMIARMMGQMLERLGYCVEERTGSLAALNDFRANPDKFDLVITDMAMPEMTGAQLAEKLVLIRPDIPIVICTGFSEKISKEKAKAMGIKGFLMKPVVKSEMAQMVRKALDERDDARYGRNTGSPKLQSRQP